MSSAPAPAAPAPAAAAAAKKKASAAVVEEEAAAVDCPVCERQIKVHGPGVRKLANAKYCASVGKKRKAFRACDEHEDECVDASKHPVKKAAVKKSKSTDETCEKKLTARMVTNMRLKILKTMVRYKKQEDFLPALAKLLDRRKMPKRSQVRAVETGRRRIDEAFADRVFDVLWSGKVKK